MVSQLKFNVLPVLDFRELNVYVDLNRVYAEISRQKKTEVIAKEEFQISSG